MSAARLILGAGAIGLVLATELTARGHEVALADPSPEPPGPDSCAWRAGGMIAPFCERESAEEPVLRLGLEAADWWERHTGLATRRGTLVLAPGRDKSELARFARRTEGHEVMDAPAIAALEPDLEGRFASGLFFAEEAHLDPRAALAELRRRLAARGVRFLPPGAAEGFAGEILDCRGLAARDLLPDLRGVRGETILLRCPDLALTRPVRLLHPRIPLYVVPRGEGLYLLGATSIESDDPGPIRVRSVLELLSSAYALHPAFGEAEILETNVGLRPAFPDNLPHLRRRGGRLFLNGLHRHGFLLSPALARMAAEHLETGARPELMEEDPA